ncbi:MAG: type II secretion system protein N [Janthinobacterium lividum]
MTPRRINLLLDCLAIGVAAALIADLAGPVIRLTSAPVAAAAPPVEPPRPPVDLASIVRWAPFGVAVPTLPETSPAILGLQLRGVMLARPQSASSALIAMRGGPPASFVVGATLPGGSVLEAVEFDLVVLRAGGRTQTLGFTRPAEAMPPGRSEAMTSATPGPADDEAGPGGGSLLGSLEAQATPGGYRVAANPSAALRRAGFAAGDIVEKVGGTAIGDPARDRATYDDAVIAGTMKVEVVRDGRHVALSLPLH